MLQNADGKADKKQSASRQGVYVHTWGTKPETEGSEGAYEFLRKGRMGENVGHASLTITIKDTADNRALVDKYLKGTKIPYASKHYETKKLKFTHAGFEKTNENAYEEDVIEIYFSYWPNKDEPGFDYFTYEQDLLSERPGVEMNYAAKWKELLNPETRRTKPDFLQSYLGRDIDLPPYMTLHEMGATPQEVKALRTYQMMVHNNNRLTAAHLLEKKLRDKVKAPGQTQSTLEGTEFNLAQQVLPNQVKKNQACNINKLIYAAQSQRIFYQEQTELNAFLHLVSLTQLNLENNPDLPQDVKLDIQESEVYKKLKNVNAILGDIDLFSPKYPNSPRKKLIDEQLKQIPELSSEFSEGITPENYKMLKQEGQNLQKALKEKEVEIRGNIQDSIHIVKMLSQDEPDSLLAFKNALKIEVLENLVQKYIVATTVGGLNENIKALRGQIKQEYQELANHKIMGNLGEIDECLQPDKLNKLLEEIQSEKYHSVRRTPAFEVFSTLFKQNWQNLHKELRGQEFNELLIKHCNEGLPPTDSVQVPLSSPQSALGLDLEGMLKEMREFADNPKRFRLIAHNCSTMVNRILHAGANNELKWIFEQKAISGAFIPPQITHNCAVQYAAQATMGQIKKIPEQSIYRLAKHSIAQVATDSLDTMIEGDASYAQMAWAFTKGAPAGILYACFEGGEALYEYMTTPSEDKSKRDSESKQSLRRQSFTPSKYVKEKSEVQSSASDQRIEDSPVSSTSKSKKNLK